MKLVKKSSTKPNLKKKSSLFKKQSLTKRKVEEEKPKYASLSEVMDRTRDISFFYSGVEYDLYLSGCYNMGIRNFLMSYHYLTGRNLKDIFEKYPDIHLFVDSGAFTYQMDAKYRDYSVARWEEHIQKYLSWAERNKEHIFAIANLDIEALVGAENVTRWNKEYFEPFMLKTGIPVCFVYHDGASSNNWEWYCERYPYVGFSSISQTGSVQDMDAYREYLRIAEKHDTLVHGFGMTKIKELSELPYYTVDSTTWKVGMRYGKLIIFDGSTVKQIAQEDWETKAIPLIRNYPINIDLDKLWEYDEPEVIRANVYAFSLAEDYVKSRVKRLQYWQKAKVVKNDLNSLSDDFFSSIGWLNGEKTPEEVIEYANKMNINSDRDIDTVALAVMDMTSFINWDNPAYAERHTEYLGDNQDILDALHDLYINRIVPDEETKISDLKKFYTECCTGARDTLLLEGTNFDRMVKERDEYIDDTEYDVTEVPREEILAKLGSLNLLPESEAPEIDDLDEEIFKKVDIVPVFDEKGRFVKGNQISKKPKNIYSKKFPKFACDTCSAAANCPEYKAGYVCAYHKLFTGFDTRNLDDVISAMQGMANQNIARMQRAMVIETINGTTDPNVTSLIDQNMRIMDNIRRLYETKNTTVVRQTRAVQADGTVTDTVSVHNPQSGGILEQLFNRKAKEDKKQPEPETEEPLKDEEESPVIEADFKEVQPKNSVLGQAIFIQPDED